MKNLLFPIVTICMALSLTNCDKVDNPVNPVTNQTTGDRKILIEEFTGQLCTFCPDGAREIERLDSIYEGQIIAVSIHAGAFADPANGAPNDFRTTAGTEYNNTFGVISWPAATISRRNNAAVLGQSQWETEIGVIKDLEPEVDISITTAYDSTSREVSITVLTEWLKDGDQEAVYNVQLFVTENHVIAGQLDNGVWKPNYSHEHMLRGAINGTWGTNLTNGTLEGTLESNKFDYTLDPTWKAKDCKIIAFVYKVGPNYEVVQANSLYIIPQGIVNTT